MSDKIKLMIHILIELGFSIPEIARDAGITPATIGNGMRETSTSGRNERKIEHTFKKFVDMRKMQIKQANEL